MIAFGFYLLKVSVCLTAFYMLYASLLKGYTFFRFNRYYLVAGLIASFLIPLLKFSLLHNQYNSLLASSFEQTLSEADYAVDQFQTVSNVAISIHYSTVFSAIYFTGIFVMLTRIVLSVRRIIAIKKNSVAHALGKLRIVKARLSQPFSFFNTVFLPEHEINPSIIEHERIHVKQFHWIDLLMAELASVVLWFNPLMLFYKRSIRLQHEYLADAGTLAKGILVEQYLDCLLCQVRMENYLGPVSQFYSTSIKKRIMMITKTKTSEKFTATYLLLIPVIAMLLISFSNRSSSPFASDANSSLDERTPSIIPLEAGKVVEITSGFGYRIHPYYNKKMFHTGIDFKTEEGTLVIATANGVILKSASDSLKGNYIIVTHRGMYKTSYWHLKSASVIVGDVVKKGQTIGVVGNTGLSTVASIGPIE